VKLNSVLVGDEIKRDARLECRSDVEGRTEFANSNLFDHIFDQTCYSLPILSPFILEFSHESFARPSLKHNIPVSSFIKYLIFSDLARSNPQIEDFDVYVELAMANFVFCDESVVADVE
jgi:hypothetical protein